MAKVVFSTPEFVRYNKRTRKNPEVACYYKASSSTRWTKVAVGEEFSVQDNKAIEVKCVVPFNESENFKPYHNLITFKGGENTITPKLVVGNPVKVVLKDGNVPIRLCNFYKDGRSISRDYTDYGEDAPRVWEDTFGIPKPNGFTWKGFKDGDFIVTWGTDSSFQLIVSAYGKKYSNVLVDIVPSECSVAEVEAVANLPEDDSTFLNVIPVQSAPTDTRTKGKTYRSESAVKDGVLYVAPKEDAFAAYIECGPTGQYANSKPTLTFECGDVVHIDPITTMLAVGKVYNRTAHKFVLPEKGYMGDIKVTSKDGVEVKIKVVGELP